MKQNSLAFDWIFIWRHRQWRTDGSFVVIEPGARFAPSKTVARLAKLGKQWILRSGTTMAIYLFIFWDRVEMADQLTRVISRTRSSITTNDGRFDRKFTAGLLGSGYWGKHNLRREAIANVCQFDLGRSTYFVWFFYLFFCASLDSFYLPFFVFIFFLVKRSEIEPGSRSCAINPQRVVCHCN